MTPKKIYISGKISGTDDYMQRFEKAENAVKKLYPEASVINPAKVNAALPEDTTYEQYMAMSLTMLDMCDTIYMMHGWEHSDGARRENSRAREHGLNILYQSNGMACEDCIHYELCEALAKNGISKVSPSDCGYYTSKSKYVEQLPCKVGDTVYCCRYAFGTISPYTVESVKITRDDEQNVLISYAAISHNEDESLDYIEFDVNDLGKTEFLTEEEAEAKLKELKENEQIHRC